MPVFGCIADDFTGASDAASFLVKGGMSVQLFNGVPSPTDRSSVESHVQAIVIALKSRTQNTADAVRDSLSAADFLLSQGVRQLYFKYCSTFDSTPAGNIGPVADALMEKTNSRYSILCPALPINGRTVVQGDLLVDGIPLHKSHMKDHPLTPMWDCNIARLMEPQSRFHSYSMDKSALRDLNPDAYDAQPFYVVPDYSTDEDGSYIAECFFHLPFLTGGSGILEPLARLWTASLSQPAYIPANETEGKALILSGSCSKATLSQIKAFQNAGYPSIKIDPEKLLSGEQTLDQLWSYIAQQNTPVMAYSSDEPEKIRQYQKIGVQKTAEILESSTAALARRAVQEGFTRIISAGGETSGAVTKALGFSSYYIGRTISPGVPIMVPTENPALRLILKSGNFGQEDFFIRALTMTSFS